MAAPKRKLSGDMSHMELDDDTQNTTNLGKMPELPPPTAEMKQFTREIRVVDHIPDSSVYVDNASPPAFKRQKADDSMQLTGIQKFVPVSTPFKRPDFDFELPKLSSSRLDTSALDAAFGRGSDAEGDEEEQTVELQVYVDPENEPPRQYDPSPARKPLAPKQLSPVQEATQESSGIQNVSAPIESAVRRSVSPLRSPIVGASHTAPIRSVPPTPRHGTTPKNRHSRLNSQHGSHQNRQKTPSRVNGIAANTPSRHAQQQGQATPSSARRRGSIQATPTRPLSKSQQRTPLKSPHVIMIPSSPERIGSPRRILSDDESFLNIDPARLESVDDLMIHLAIHDFNPTSINEVLPAKEVELVGLNRCQELIALTLQSEIDRMIAEGQSLETQLKKFAEKMNVQAIMARYQTYDRQDRRMLKQRFNNVYEHLQAKAEVKTAEAELEVSRQMHDRLKELRADYSQRHEEFRALRQKSKEIEQEIDRFRNLQDDEVTLDEEIRQLKEEVDERNEKLATRKEDITNIAIKNRAHEKFWSKLENIRDPTKETTDEAWHRRQYCAKKETLRTLLGVIDVRIWRTGMTLVLPNLEISSYEDENELRLKLFQGNSPLVKHFFGLLNKFKSIKENLNIWKRYTSINSHLKQLRRLQFYQWVQENKDTLLFKLNADQGTVHIQFYKSSITVEWCDLEDKGLEGQILKLSGEDAITVLASKLCN